MPDVPFFVNEDLSTPDGVVRCRKITEAELLQLSWKMLRVVKQIGRIPIPY